MKIRLAIVAVVAATGVSAAAYADSTPVPNPYAGPDGTSSMHGDSAASDTTPYSGPGPSPAAAQYVPVLAACPTILAGADGMVLTLCTGIVDRSPRVLLVDPHTGEPVANLALEAGDLLGGVYAYVDNQDRLVTVDGSGRMLWIGHDHGGLLGAWRLYVDRAVDLTSAIASSCGSPTCDSVVTVAPGYDGRVWFATSHGRVGYVSLSDSSVRLLDLGDGEQVANSIATSPAGLAVATDHALYQVAADGSGHIRVQWRQPYDRGLARKPGQLSWGTGATPTYFGPVNGTKYVAITDNARPLEHLLVYEADSGQLHCEVPLLGPDNSGTENSPIALGNQVYVASTYGYPYPALPADAGPSDPASAPFVGGMERFDVTAQGGQSRWTNAARSAAVPRLSRPEGVIYTVERDALLGLADASYLVRIDPHTGAVLSRTLLGAGPEFDTLQMVGTILPSGTLLQGTLTGYVVVRPGHSQSADPRSVPAAGRY